MFRRIWHAVVRWWWMRKLERVGISRADAVMFVNAVLSGQIPARKL